MGDRCLTSAQLQSQERRRQLETQLDWAFGISFLYYRDKEEDSGKEEARKPSARRKSGNISMGSLHRGHHEVTAQGTFTYMDIRTGCSWEGGRRLSHAT